MGMMTSASYFKKLGLPTICSFCIQDMGIGAVTSLYLLCCILRTVKIKDLANTIVSAFLCPQRAFVSLSEAKVNGGTTFYNIRHSPYEESSNGYRVEDGINLKVDISEDVSLPDSPGDLNQSLR